MADELYAPYEEKMKKTVSVLREELSAIRAGRANPALLDKIAIDYYGTLTPINQLCNISVPEAKVILIQPWEAKLLKDIEKAIQKSDIGINPNNDGKIIRLVFPVLNEERRKELIKMSKKLAEESKVAVRAIRRDAVEHFKKLKKAGELTEDDLKDSEKDIQAITEKFVVDVDKVLADKEKEIMEI
ncbi:MAG: ribosome recycling factor [Clostridiales bacterium]|jgi:ribosome recycling factor|nr:ribosome recycling factor [Clostridiales bacterium]